MNLSNSVPYNTNTFNNEMIANPLLLMIIVIVLLAYFVLFSSLGISTSSPTTISKSTGESSGLEIIIWSIFIFLIIVNGFAYLFNINITANIKNLFTSEPELDIIVDTDDMNNIISNKSVPEITFEKQVFHIPDNKFNYEDSKAICKAYGGRLATWQELEDSYQDGADWCGYGWSDGQMALYPTQLHKWKELQKHKGHEHDCGRPGINGGYIANPNVKFGINCYGYKPEITSSEASSMRSTPLYPITKKEQEFNKRVDYWKTKLPEIIVAPFNHNNWSII